MSAIPLQREQFAVPRDVAYLNCAYMSPTHQAVAEASRRAEEIKARPWEVGSEIFFEPVATLRDRFAQLIGSSARDVVLGPAVSYVLATAAANVPIRSGQKIVLLAEQFPSNYYCWAERAKKERAELSVVERPAQGTWSDALLRAVDQNTAVVTLPNVHWTDGTVFDLAAIAAKARAVGAAVVVDLSQSLGVLPFSVEEVEVDFLVATGYKWLLGPYGLALGYVHPRWHEGGRPLENNWIHRHGSEDFSQLVEYQDSYQPGARRFESGQSSAFHAVATATAALELILAWEPERIAETLGRWTTAFCDEASGLDLEFLPPEVRSPHLLGVRFPGGLPTGLVSRLRSEKVFLSSRGDSLRVAPHLYNDREDADRLLSLLRAAR